MQFFSNFNNNSFAFILLTSTKRILKPYYLTFYFNKKKISSIIDIALCLRQFQIAFNKLKIYLYLLKHKNIR